MVCRVFSTCLTDKLMSAVPDLPGLLSVILVGSIPGETILPSTLHVKPTFASKFFEPEK